MSISRLGGISRIHRNGVDLIQVRRGSQLIWSSNILLDTFNRDDANTLGEHWTSTGTGYKLGISSGGARLAVPDGLVALALNTDYARFNAATLDNDDYDLEIVVGSKGASDSITGTKHRTEVFARGSNTGVTHGVGIDLYGSAVSIVRRVASVNTIMKAGGAYAPGDRVRLRGVGNLHNLYVNGEFRVQWDDSSGTAQKGSGYRSLILRADGSKDLLGPRRFSASIDSVQLA
ncbi:hypothetical protein SEA_ALLEGRO_43 [Mycobacterium phage Allegro]|nr:hypothetical protein SEA_ALLEGRO_43 [Mycobacterium phage Allegro]